MTPQPDSLPLLTVLAALHGALERLTAALVTGQPDPVLAADESLGAAVRQLAGRKRLPAEDRGQLVDAIRAIRVAVGVSQRLGRASAALMQATVQSAAYAADGQLAPALV